MRLTTQMQQVLSDILANRVPTPSITDPTITQSLRKRGLIERTNTTVGYTITPNGKTALNNAQKGKS